MNLMDDPLNVVSDLRPAGLDRLAEDTYARRRAGDLARMLGEPAPGGLLTASGLLTVSGLPAPDGRVAPAAVFAPVCWQAVRSGRASWWPPEPHLPPPRWRRRY